MCNTLLNSLALYENEEPDPAHDVLLAVVKNLTDRAGFDAVWDSMAEWDKEELLAELLEIVEDRV